jgi:hypothetical protein
MAEKTMASTMIAIFTMPSTRFTSMSFMVSVPCRTLAASAEGMLRPSTTISTLAMENTQLHSAHTRKLPMERQISHAANATTLGSAPGERCAMSRRPAQRTVANHARKVRVSAAMRSSCSSERETGRKRLPGASARNTNARPTPEAIAQPTIRSGTTQRARSSAAGRIAS